MDLEEEVVVYLRYLGVGSWSWFIYIIHHIHIIHNTLEPQLLGSGEGREMGGGGGRVTQ